MLILSNILLFQYLKDFYKISIINQVFVINNWTVWMDLITWNKSFETGHPIVDGQHKKLFAMVNQLHTAIAENHTKLVLTDTMEKLSDYVATHFKTEEEIMLSNNFPDYENHKKQHEDLKEQAFKLIKLFSLGKIDLSATISKFLSDWLQHHILENDVKMILQLKKSSSN